MIHPIPQSKGNQIILENFSSVDLAILDELGKKQRNTQLDLMTSECFKDNSNLN